MRIWGVFGRHAPWFLAPFVLQVVLSFQTSDRTVGSPGLLFGIVVVAAGLCAVVAGLVIARAFATQTAELAWLGCFFMAASILPLVHGLTTPGVLYGDNSATMVSVILAIPVALLSAIPLALDRHGPTARKWRGWTISWLVILSALAIALLVWPSAIAVPNMRSAAGVAVAVGSALGCFLLARRHIDLATIANRRSPLIVAIGYALVAGSAGVLFEDQPYSVGFWLAHAFDITGVFAATIGALLVYRRTASMTEVLAPIVAVEPIAALEVGMHPAVIEFVADLETKDPMTRDHVVRTAELAIEVAELMRLPPDVQRRAGLVGALHDIGKLEIPDEILTKPGALNDVEWRIMRSHAALGSEILGRCEHLADLAPAVRGHHERLDGAGYPDGLAGEEIPLEARIVSVCDAYDAMAYTRRYRSAMELDEVLSILRKHAGTQWDPLIVQAVINIVSRRSDYEPRLLDGHKHDRCDCLPRELAGELLEPALPVGSFSGEV